MAIIKKKKAAETKNDVYEKADDLPEGRKKKYDSILEDFSRQIDERVKQIYAAINAMENQIRSKYKVALMKLPRNVRELKYEDELDELCGDPSLDLNPGQDLKVEMAKVAANVASSVSDKLTSTVKESSKKKATEKKKRTTKKKSSILAAAPNTSVLRRSSRRRLPTSHYMETPLASSTLTAAALGRSSAKSSAAPRGFLASAGLINPKFNMATPLSRTVMRAQRADERLLVSMNGSPVYVGGRAKKDKVLSLPMANGKTLVVPTDDPEIQPIVEHLRESCMARINAKK